MKISLRNAVRIIILLPLGLYFGYCCYRVMTNEWHPKYLDCGRVVSKSNDEVAIKHGSRTELYLNIQFEKTGFKSIECDPTTYFRRKVGDEVCFNLRHKIPFWDQINFMVGVFVITIISLILFALLIDYLLPDFQ